MAKFTPIKSDTPWQAVSVTMKDWDAISDADLLNMFFKLHIVRAFEEKILEFDRDGVSHGPIHTSVGQEAIAVGAVTQLRPSDQVLGSYRAHHHFLCKGLGFVDPDGFDLLNDEPPEPAKAFVRRTMAEIIGLEEGFGRGRGGSPHLRWAEAGFQGSSAIVGGQIPLATGVAWSMQHKAAGDVVFAFLGDGSMHIGATHEAFNLAALYNLPICFVIENNGYAVSTTVAEQTRETRLSSRGFAYGIPSYSIDGMDPVAVRTAATHVIAELRSGKGPALIEADVYRFYHHSSGAKGSAFGYRSKEEESDGLARDPFLKVASALRDRRVLDDETEAAIQANAASFIGGVGDELTEIVDGTKRQIRSCLLPEPESIKEGVRGDLSEMDGLRFEELESFSGDVNEERFVKLVAGTMERRMETDDRIFCIGEDIHKLNGGPKGATRGLRERFSDRVVATPIAEEGFCGLAGGAAMEGTYRPVVELMYPDFCLVAADQIFNQIAKIRHMFGGKCDVPLVLRTAIALGSGYGSQHSMDPAGLFAMYPGWRIVAPSTPFDYVGLMNSALQCNDPVLVLEHAGLFKTKGPAPVSDLDYFIPFGKAKVLKTGNDVTVLSYLAMLPLAIRAAEQTAVDAEIIDLRSLDMAGIDWDTITESVSRTNNVLIVEEGSWTASYGGLLADEVQRRLFDYLDQPVKRVHGSEASPVCSKLLEQRANVAIEDIVSGFEDVMTDLGRFERSGRGVT